MSFGYTLRLRDANERADPRKLGVRLGRQCIRHDIPVVAVANHMGVSRATVYNWFCGAASPHASNVGRIEAYITSLG